MSRRERWMLAGIGFNTIASLTAIALWVVAPQGRDPAKRPPDSAAVSLAPLPSQPIPPSRRPPVRRLDPGTAAQPSEEAVAEAPVLGARLTQRQADGAAVSASVVALGERLHL